MTNGSPSRSKITRSIVATSKGRFPKVNMSAEQSCFGTAVIGSLREPRGPSKRWGDFKFNLEGERLHGGFVLVRMAHDRERNKRTNWLLIINRTCWLSGQGVSQLAARCCLGALRASGRVLVRLS
jgi:hypothetical protein